VLNPLLPIYRRRELTHVIEVAAPKAIVTAATYRGYDHVAEVAALLADTGHPARHLVVPGDASAPDDLGDALALADVLSGVVSPALGTTRPASAISEIIFTSGTESVPKAVMHTEQTANFSVRVAHSDLAMGPSDVVWMPSPIGHSTGFNYGVRFALYHGLPLVLQDRWDAAVAFDLVSTRRASYTLASTTFLQDLVAEADRRCADLPSRSRFSCGGSPVPPELVRRAADRGLGVLRLYGSTEVLCATWNRPGGPWDKVVATDGPALSHIEVDVRDEEGQRCPPGEPGELHVRGPDTCVGFFADPDRTAATFVDGWVRSGDLVTIDTEGFVTVVGRKKEIVIRGGLNIAPREIEDMLLDFPEVDRVAVVGLPDDRLGERVCACVVPVAGATLAFEDMVARLRQAGLATFKLPERLELLESLPMTASGKVQKFEIVRSLTGG
jgi:cyclohexanecarboxylate-CoA ligase